MQYRYTVRGGYDKLIKKKVEKGTLFAVPIAILAIVGLAALTSNTTSGPGIGSGSKGRIGQPTVTKTFQTTANNQPGSIDAGTAGVSPSWGLSSGSLHTSGSTVKSIQSTAAASTGSVPAGTITTGTVETSPLGTTTIDPTQCLCQAVSPITQPLTQAADSVANSITSPVNL